MSDSLRPLAKAPSREADLSAHEQAGRFDAWIRGARALLGLTQESMAQALDAPLSTYKDWEYGRTVPKAPWVWKVKRLLAEHNRDSQGRIRVAV